MFLETSWENRVPIPAAEPKDRDFSRWEAEEEVLARSPYECRGIPIRLSIREFPIWFPVGRGLSPHATKFNPARDRISGWIRMPKFSIPVMKSSKVSITPRKPGTDANSSSMRATEA